MEFQTICRKVFWQNQNQIKTLMLNQVQLNNQLLRTFDEQDAITEEYLKILEWLQAQTKFRFIWRYPSSTDWWDHKVPLFPEKLFIQHFRVNFQIFDYLVAELGSSLYKEDTSWRDALPVRKKIAVGLKLLATTCDYLKVASLFGIGRSTAHKCFKDFINAVYSVFARKLIKFPETSDEFFALADENKRLWQFPMAFGSIDGSHIAFSPPSRLASDFYNYKGWKSIMLLAIVDARGRAIWTKTGIPGRQSDSGAFKESSLFHKIRVGAIPNVTKGIQGNRIPLVLLGDSGFSLEPWLMKPFTHSEMTRPRKIFNYRLSRARRSVENFFGRLKVDGEGCIVELTCCIKMPIK